jgi:hypothetical protein
MRSPGDKMKSNNQAISDLQLDPFPYNMTAPMKTIETPTFGPVKMRPFAATTLDELKAIRKLYSMLQKELQPRFYVKDVTRIGEIANITRAKKGHIVEPIILAMAIDGTIYLIQGHGRDGSLNQFRGYKGGTIPFGSVNFCLVEGYFTPAQLQILASELQPPDESPAAIKKPEIIDSLAKRLANGFDHKDLGIPAVPYNKLKRGEKTKLKNRLFKTVQHMKPKWKESTIEGLVSEALMTSSNTDKKFINYSQEEANVAVLPTNIAPYQAVPNKSKNEIDMFKAMNVGDRTKTIGSFSEHLNGTLTSHLVETTVDSGGERKYHVSPGTKKKPITENYPWVNDQTVYNIFLSVYIVRTSIKDIGEMQEAAEKTMSQLASDVKSWLDMIAGSYNVRVTISRELNPQFGYTLDEDDARNEFGTNCQVKNRKFTVQNF